MTEVPSQQVPDCGSIQAAFGQAPVCSAGCELVFEASCVQPRPKAAHHRRTGDGLQGPSSIGQMKMLVHVRIMRALAEPLNPALLKVASTACEHSTKFASSLRDRAPGRHLVQAVQGKW